MIKTCENCGNQYSESLKLCPHCGFNPSNEMLLTQKAERIERMKRHISDFFACCLYCIITVICNISLLIFFGIFFKTIPSNRFIDFISVILFTSFPFMVAYRVWLKRTSDYTSTRYVSGFLSVIFSSFPSLLLFFTSTSHPAKWDYGDFIEIALPMVVSLVVFRFIRYKNNSKANKKKESFRYIIKSKTAIWKEEILYEVKKSHSIIMNICSAFAIAPLFIYMFRDNLGENSWFILTAISFLTCIVIMHTSSEETIGVAFLFMLALPLVTLDLFRYSHDWPLYLGCSIICLGDYFHLSYSHMQNKEKTEEYSKKCKYLEERVNELEELLRRKKDK